MRTVRIPNVGHGLAAELTTISDEVIQIDCGSMGDSNAAYERSMGHRLKTSVFFLSHFHTDHYNGLVTAPESSQYIEKVIFPGMPDHKIAERFLRALFTTDSLKFCKETGSLPGDLYQNICRINNNNENLSFKPKFKGDTVQVGSTQFDVLWPPEDPSDHTIKPLVDGVELFDKALEKDDQLKEIYEEVVNQEMVEPYLADEERHSNLESGIRDIDYIDSLAEEYEPSEASEKAYEKLKNAADRMSLAMHVDNRLLFMGDLKQPDIKDVVEQLLSKGRNHFYILITPHHGTRWDDSMNRINTVWAVSSAGETSLEHLSSKYRSISERNWVTHLNGNLTIPAHGRGSPHVPREHRWPFL